MLSIITREVEATHITPHDPGPVPELVPQETRHHHRRGQVHLEKRTDLPRLALLAIPDGPRGCPELRHQHETIERETDPTPDDPGLAAERQLVETVALAFPAAAEADVRETDAAPGEDGREAGEGKHPVESGLLFFRAGEKREEAEERGERDGDDGSAFAVDVSQEARGLALFCQGRECAGTAVDAAVADGEDGDHDDCVED